MTNYGKNFEFRAQPHQRERGARYVLDPAGDEIPFGAPVVVDEDATDAGLRQVLVPAVGDVQPMPGKTGIALYEHAWEAVYGQDPVLTRFSDIDKAPVGGKSVYLVFGSGVKIVLRNTEDYSFMGQRNYAGRTMIAGVDAATPTVQVGDLLRPHDSPSDENGYWQVATGGEDAWLRVDHVDADRNEVEARFLF